MAMRVYNKVSSVEKSRVETTQPKCCYNNGGVSHPGEHFNVEANLCNNKGKNNRGAATASYTGWECTYHSRFTAKTKAGQTLL